MLTKNITHCVTKNVGIIFMGIVYSLVRTRLLTMYELWSYIVVKRF